MCSWRVCIEMCFWTVSADAFSLKNCCGQCLLVLTPNIKLSTPVIPSFFQTLCRNWTHRPGPHRALQHPGLRRLPLAGTVQRSRPPQVRTENHRAGPGYTNRRSAGQTTWSRLAGVLPGQTGGVQLRGITSNHPTNVCCNRSLASGQDRWGLTRTALRNNE